MELSPEPEDKDKEYATSLVKELPGYKVKKEYQIIPIINALLTYKKLHDENEKLMVSKGKINKVRPFDWNVELSNIVGPTHKGGGKSKRRKSNRRKTTKLCKSRNKIKRRSTKYMFSLH